MSDFIAPDFRTAIPMAIRYVFRGLTECVSPDKPVGIAGNCLIGSYLWLTTLTGTEKHGALSGC